MHRIQANYLRPEFFSALFSWYSLVIFLPQKGHIFYCTLQAAMSPKNQFPMHLPRPQPPDCEGAVCTGTIFLWYTIVHTYQVRVLTLHPLLAWLKSAGRREPGQS